MIRKQQHEIVAKLLQQKKSTPYYGMLAEIGEMPYTDTIFYKKLMFHYKLINSDEKREARRILVREVSEDNNWYTELKEYADEIEVNISMKEMKSVSYAVFKKMIKRKIKEKIEKGLKIMKKEKTKLRFITPKLDQ